MALFEPTLASADRPATCAWRLRLLGAVELRHHHGGMRRLPTRAATALLALLALSPQRSHPREELIELLWPGVALDVGRNRLRQTLSTLRRLLEADGEPVIDADRSSLRLRPDSVECDAVAFANLVQRGALQAARAVHGGELMPGFYDEWVLESRRRLETLLERVEARLAESTTLAPAVDDPLPASWTRAFGIERSVEQLMGLVRRERLVCVVGPGGSGKTRLCLESARALRATPSSPPRTGTAAGTVGGFARIVFVPLADCYEEAQALDALAGAVHASGPDPLEALKSRLADLPVLLVLDNFEQLVAPAARLLLRLLEALPCVHLMISSRWRLQLPGEHVFPLGGLPVPVIGADEAGLIHNPAVALFVDRARAARPDFRTDAATLAAVAVLVRLLDGMPLALELAASRVASHPPAQLIGLLSAGIGGGESYLPLLTRQGPRAGHDPRHASIEQVIDWSWRLASPAEQELLAALSCFAGDAGLAALAAVLGATPARVAAGLDELAAHSLVTVLPATAVDDTVRYALVEPVREFVRSRWPPTALEALHQAQWRWLLAWANALGAAAEPGRVERELRTVLSALNRAGEAPTQALSLALALRPHWESVGMPAALQQTLDRALSEVEAGVPDPALLSAGHELLSYLRFEAGFAATALLHAEAALRHAGSNGSLRARALVRRAWLELAAGRNADPAGTQDTPVQGWLEEALTLARQHGDREGLARALHQLAVVASHRQGDWAKAEALLEQSQTLWLALGDRRKAFARLRNRGQCWLRLGRAEDAQACFEQCERSACELGDVVGRIDSLLSLSSLLAARRRWRDALEVDRRCIALCWRHWHRHGLAYALWNPPRAMAHLRQPEDAIRLMAFAATFWETRFGPLAHADRQTVRRVRGLVRAQRGAAQTEALWIEGASMDIRQAVALALRTPTAGPEAPARAGAATPLAAREPSGRCQSGADGGHSR